MWLYRKYTYRMVGTPFRIAISAVGSVAVVTMATLSQPHFVAGSLPDLVCELLLLPGKLFATMFHDRGNASPKFLWRSRVATAVIFTGMGYLALRQRKARA
jgi:hypothetical protein